MQNRQNIPIDAVIAKIDNDFNPDNSDWINRVPSWCNDAMNQLGILSYTEKKRKVPVINRIARLSCPIKDVGLRVFDLNKCEIKRLESRIVDETNDEIEDSNITELTDTINIVENPNVEGTAIGSIGHTTTNKDINKRVVVENRFLSPVEDECYGKNFVKVDSNKLELNFDTAFIYVYNYEVATEYSEYFQEEVPVIPNNGLLIESLAYYCMYKMLCRGMKHPVFNLAASQYGTNPYFMWINMKDKARTSVINAIQSNPYSDEWRNYFYNYTFPK